MTPVTGREMNPNRPSLSSVDVIVPCYRYAHLLRQCVESVLHQSIPNVRVLIIDDASPDNTVEVAEELVQEDERVTFFHHTANKGHIATYNEGIEWASADYLLLLSADDYLLPGALNRATQLMDAHPEVGLTYGNVIVRKDGETTTYLEQPASAGKAWRILSGLEFIELSGSTNIVGTPSAVVRTALQKRLGGYRPELPHSGDMEMWLRFAAHSSVGIIEANQAVYRRHSANMSSEYYLKGQLRDLEQRKGALDWFFEVQHDALPDAPGLRRRLCGLLACDAVDFASTALDEGETELVERLSQFAAGVSPQVKRSLRWIKLSAKRRVGIKVWHTLKSATTNR
jgi:hypothetical protein